jgi:uncharacterized membrane protein
MTWVGRYRKNLSGDVYKVPANKPVLMFLMIFAVAMLIVSGTMGIIALTLIAATFAVGFVFERISSTKTVEA